MSPTWDVLIPTIPHRHESLCALLEEFNRQALPGFGVRILRDNLRRRGIASYAKWQDLADSSSADYISYAGDDDWVAPDFVIRVMEALEYRPDYVGFRVRFILSGREMPPVTHSLSCGNWIEVPVMARDIVHQNPMRRELSTLARWGTWKRPEEDYLWAASLRATGKVKTEEWIDDEMYWYQASPARGFWVTSTLDPYPEPLPELPSYPWLTVVPDSTL